MQAAREVDHADRVATSFELRLQRIQRRAALNLVGPLREPKFGRSAACCGVSPQSTSATMLLAT
jgi:hypothetical protein